jgi:hypothetical protein
MADKAIVITGAIVVLVGAAMCTTSSKTPAPQQRPLSVEVVNKLDAFSVRNNDSHPWQDCDLEINSDYKLKVAYVAPAATVTFSSMEFAKSDGTRFNWRATKPQQMYVYCRQAPSAPSSALVGWR